MRAHWLNLPIDGAPIPDKQGRCCCRSCCRSRNSSSSSISSSLNTNTTAIGPAASAAAVAAARDCCYGHGWRAPQACCSLLCELSLWLLQPAMQLSLSPSSPKNVRYLPAASICELSRAVSHSCLPIGVSGQFYDELGTSVGFRHKYSTRARPMLCYGTMLS